MKLMAIYLFFLFDAYRKKMNMPETLLIKDLLAHIILKLHELRT